MLFSPILFVLSFAGLAIAQDASLSALQKAFHDANVSGLRFDDAILYQVDFLNRSQNP